MITLTCLLQEHLKILYYLPDELPINRKVRNIGLCEALVNFSKTFSSEKTCEIVHTQKTKQSFLEPEPGIWMALVRMDGWMDIDRQMKEY